MKTYFVIILTTIRPLLRGTNVDEVMIAVDEGGILGLDLVTQVSTTNVARQPETKNM